MRSTEWPRRRRTKSRGQSMVEFGLTLPILLLLLLGTIDLGRAFFDYIQMRNAAYEGARYGARNPTDSSGIQSAVTQHGVPSGTSVTSSVAAADSSTPATCCTIGGNYTVTVTLSHTFTPITTSFLQRFWGIRPWTLNAAASARVVT